MDTKITLYNRIDIFNQTVELQRVEIQRQNQLLAGVGAIVSGLMSDRDKVANLLIENMMYKKMYGEFETPLLILKEMLKSGQIKVGGIAVPPKNFKHPAIEFTKPNRDKVNYWVSLFEEWGIIDNSSSKHYIIEMPHKKAKKILLEKIGDKDG